MCCGDPSLKFIGIIGTFLLLFGFAQIGIGVYCMLVLPAFTIASNIWTGSATGLTGFVSTYMGFTNQAKRRSYAIIILSLITLLTNVMNLVIIQVGERSKFLTEEALDILEKDSEKKLFFDIAIWSSTGLSSLVILCTFLVSQYLFCRNLGPSKKSGQISYINTLHQEKAKSTAGNRFFPPSRLAASKVDDPHSSENGLWIPRHWSLSSQNEDTLRQIGGSIGDGGGGDSLDRRNEVLLGFDIRRTTLELRAESRRLDDHFDYRIINGGEKNDQSIVNNSNRLSTFRPKRRSSKAPNTNQDTQSPQPEVEKIDKCVEEASPNNKAGDEDIPAFLQNHPSSWMFLLPNVFTKVAGISSWDKFIEENVTSKPDENKTEGIDNSGNPTGNSSLAPVTYTSTEKLFTPSPKTKTKSKRPKEPPPLPPNVNPP